MQVFYTPASEGKAQQVIDGAHEFNGKTVGMYSHETLEQLAVRYPGVMLGDADEVMSQRESMLTTAPEQITEEQFMDALEALPPEGWIRANGGESFKFAEYYSGRITSIYARDGATYWTFRDVGTKTHAQIMEKVRNAQGKS